MTKLLYDNQNKCQKKVLHLHLQQRIVLVQKDLISTLKFNGDCLKQNSESFINEDVSNLCISYKFNAWSKDLKGDLALSNCLFGVVKLTKNADLKVN